MSDKTEFVVPLRIDTSQVEQDLKAVDAQLKKVQRDAEAAQRQAIRAFNTSGIVGNGPGQVRAARTIADVQATTKIFSPQQLQANLPGVATAMQRLQQAQDATAARIKQIEAQARRGDTTPAPTDAQAARQRLSAATAAAAAQRQATQQRHMAAVSMPYRVAATQKMLIDAQPTFFDKMAKATKRGGPALDVYRAAGGRIPAAARTASSLMSGVMTLAETNPAMAAAMIGVTTTAGGLLAANESQTSFRRQQAALASATVGGPLLGNQRTLMGLQVSDIAKNLSVSQDQAQGLIQSLATTGTGQGDLTRNLQSSVMLAGPNQLPYGDVANLAGSLGTGGGLDARGINRTFQDVTNVAHDSRISVAQLVQSMKALSTTAVGSAKDVGGLAAVQATVGASSGVNAGQLLSPVLSATGAQAYSAAGILGMTPEQLTKDQTSKGGTAEIYDRIASLVRRVGRGPHGVTTAETVLNSTGLIDSSQLNPTTYRNLIRGMLTGTPDQATAKAAQLYTQADAQRKTEAQALQDTAHKMQDLSTWTERVSYWFQNLTTHGFNAPPPPPPGPPPVIDSHAGGNKGPWAAAQAALQSEQRSNFPQYAMDQAANALKMQGPVRTGLTVRGSKISGALYAQAYQASGGDPETLAILLAQMQKEATNPRTHMVDPSIISTDGGRGLGQWTDPHVARKYLGKDWRNAALDPAKSLAGMVAYDKDLLKGTGGNVPLALAQYNGGPRPNAQALQYGQQVFATAQDITGQINVVVTVKHDGTATAQVQQQRVVVGAKSHYVPPAHRPGPR